MQSVLDLLEARSQGGASNDQVETAVLTMFQQQQTQSTTATVVSTFIAAVVEERLTIQPDLENYDDDDDSVNDGDAFEKNTAANNNPTVPAIDSRDNNENDTPAATAAVSATTTDMVVASQSTQTTTAVALEAAPVQKRKRGRPRKNPLPENGIFATAATAWVAYEDIPLGKQGAQMMTTFGDGNAPLAGSVAASLQGARRMLQTAIQDARHVGRKQRVIYRSAKDSLKEAQQHKPTNKQEWSSEILFRASQGYDPLSYDPKCGFGVDEIRQLFPEEMNAYNRWNEMHTTATAKEEEKARGVDAGDAEPSETLDNNDNTTKSVERDPWLTTSCDRTGHLHERASQFDLRTERMQGDWYLKYAALRQGSFLPRRNKTTAGSLDAEWETARKSKVGRGCSNKKGVWAHMSAPTVRFLHWLGFDPMSALPPPTEEVAQALAFLGYDFFGRIVEKAILLRNSDQLSSASVGNRNGDEMSVLVELAPGEQLTEKDIIRATEHADVKPVPLYSNASDKKKGLQLYFGEGFEDRLEMEMEEMMWGISKKENVLTAEELEIRRQEDELFANLAKPPTKDGIAALLSGNDDKTCPIDTDDTEKPKTRPAKEKKQKLS